MTGPIPAELAGDWRGDVQIPGSPLPFGIHLAADGTGTIDIPVQTIIGHPLTGISAEGDSIRFTIDGIPGDPTFAGTRSGESINGTFTQFGQSFPFSLERGTVEALARPQEPKAPFPYRVEEVGYEGAGATLAGTLTLPEGPGPFPAVILITGSGAQDRDETIAGHKPFLLLADTLTRAGYAVLRTDDRGVGGSSGDLTSASYDQLADDVRAGIARLRTRPEIDPNRIGLLGHSEGGLIAPLVAQRGPGEVAFVVLMAGPAVQGLDVLLLQNELLLKVSGASEEQIRTQVDNVRRVGELLRAGDLAGAEQLTRQQGQQEGASAEQIDAAVAQLASLRFFLAYDPVPALQALQVPVYAFFGSKDLQVPPSQSEGPMRAALAGNPDATVQVFDGLNHLMQPAQTGSPAEYATIETTIDPVVLTAVTDWLKAR